MPNISTSNSKLGSCIATVNLPAGKTCNPDAPCSKTCYAKHGRFLFKSVRNCYERNLQEYLYNPKAYFDNIDSQLYFKPFRFFRWHSSGDIPDMNYLEGMVSVAEHNSSTKFLCFTKQFDIVNTYLKDHDGFPENLIVVFSNWGDWKCDNPFELPTAWVRFNNIVTAIPETARECSGFCGECVKSASCWTLKSGESVVFNQH